MRADDRFRIAGKFTNDSHKTYYGIFKGAETDTGKL